MPNKTGLDRVPKYRDYINGNEKVKEWLDRRPANTQIMYSRALLDFCEFSRVTPDEFQKMDSKRARNLSWDYLKTLLDKPSVAKNAMAALKSFYRNHDGETLPFDSLKGGKHYIHSRRKKASYEHVPTKAEVYQIVDMAASLRDRAMMLMLFQSGIRLNALLNLNYGHVKEQLEKGTIPLHLKITDDLDTKLRGYEMPFYDTFLGKEAVEALKRFCEIKHKTSSENTPLFISRRNNRICDTAVWFIVKRCIARVGYNIRTMWVHSLRKAFKAELRKANIQEELSESLMGHRLKGSRENYMNRNDAIDELRKAYEQADFSRDGKGDISDIVSKFNKRDIERFEDRKSNCFLVSIEEIRQNNYDLSCSRYKEIEYKEVVYEDPEVIKQKILDLEDKITKTLQEITLF